jgi:serine/threonine protein kinase
VVTLWYRAPEILLGAQQYHSAADMWSVGCIFGELLKHRPFLNGENELGQLDLIFKLLGSPNSKIWPGYDALPATASRGVPHYAYSTLTSEFPDLSENGRNLLKGLLYYDPAKRLTAAQVTFKFFFSSLFMFPGLTFCLTISFHGYVVSGLGASLLYRLPLTQATLHDADFPLEPSVCATRCRPRRRGRSVNGTDFHGGQQLSIAEAQAR